MSRGWNKLYSKNRADFWQNITASGGSLKNYGSAAGGNINLSGTEFSNSIDLYREETVKNAIIWKLR